MNPAGARQAGNKIAETRYLVSRLSRLITLYPLSPPLLSLPLLK